MENNKFVDPQAAMSFLMSYGDAVHLRVDEGVDLATPLCETTLIAKEHWAQLVAQFAYSELGFHDSLRHIVSLLNKDFQELLQEEGVLVGAGVQSYAYNLPGYLTDGGLKYDQTAQIYEIVTTNASSAIQDAFINFHGSAVQHVPIHLKIFPVDSVEQF